MPTASQRSAAFGRLLDIVVRIGEDMTTGLARDGLTAPRAHVLWELHHHGPMTQRALADSMNVTPRNVTGLVDGLVSTGFVTRQPHPTDRRAILVSFTDHGAATAKSLERGEREFADLLFSGLPDERFDCLVAGLEHVLERLRAHDIPPRADEPDTGS